MAERQTLARPYAEAVFRLAQERNELAAWSQMLVFASAVAADERMIRLAVDPHIGRTRLTELFLDIGGKNLSAAAGNFIRLLVENRRLTLLPDIAKLFEELKAQAEGRVDAIVTSAFVLDAAQTKNIEQALKRKLGRDINLSLQVDKSLIGGITVRAGDLVIDGSVRGRLADLATHMSH